MKRGFTIIETLIYIALFSFIIGSGFVSAYYIITASESGKESVNTIAEAEFLLRKIDWALSGVDSITTPSAGGTSNDLTLKKSADTSTTIVINTETTSKRARLYLNTNFELLTNERVVIEDLEFTHIDFPSPKPDAIIASFTADGQNFSMTKYLRK